jgi:antitoxin CptB
LSGNNNRVLPPAQLRWRCRRGALELDVLLRRYFDQRFDQAPDAERRTFEYLLTLPDPELLRYFMGQTVPDDGAVADRHHPITSSISQLNDRAAC